MHLIFDQTKIPRTTTRREWRKLHQWRRVTERELLNRTAEAITNLLIFGVNDPRRAAAIDRIVNPPLLLGPFQ